MTTSPLRGRYPSGSGIAILLSCGRRRLQKNADGGRQIGADRIGYKRAPEKRGPATLPLAVPEPDLFRRREVSGLEVAFPAGQEKIADVIGTAGCLRDEVLLRRRLRVGEGGAAVEADVPVAVQQ